MAGIPYMGSKRKLAHRIVDVIFNRHNSEKFYDLFGGGWLFRQTAVI
jgi:site-specific DNA-adenine methylase